MQNALIDEAEQIKSYFLGKLNMSDAEELELRLISDTEFESTVIAAENELIEDRLDEALSEEETRGFDENYLVTAERVKNVETVSLLRKFSKEKARSAAALNAVEDKSGSILDKIRSLFLGIPTVAYAWGILLIVGAAAAYIWLGSGTAYGGLQAEYASLNKQDLSDLDKFMTIPLITATPGSLRGSGSGVKLAAVDGSVFVRLSLIQLKDQPTFNLSLIRSQTVLLQLDSLRSYDAGSGREIRLLLPAKLLEKGTYQIKAIAPDHPDTPLTYGFTVE